MDRVPAGAFATLLRSVGGVKQAPASPARTRCFWANAIVSRCGRPGDRIGRKGRERVLLAMTGDLHRQDVVARHLHLEAAVGLGSGNVGTPWERMQRENPRPGDDPLAAPAGPAAGDHQHAGDDDSSNRQAITSTVKQLRRSR